MMRDSHVNAGLSCGSCAKDVNSFLERIGYETVVGAPEFIEKQKALDLLLVRYDSIWQGLHDSPREAPDRVKLTTYFRWFDRSRWLDRSSFFVIGP